MTLTVDTGKTSVKRPSNIRSPTHPYHPRVRGKDGDETRGDRFGGGSPPVRDQITRTLGHLVLYCSPHSGRTWSSVHIGWSLLFSTSVNRFTLLSVPLTMLSPCSFSDTPDSSTMVKTEPPPCQTTSVTPSWYSWSIPKPHTSDPLFTHVRSVLLSYSFSGGPLLTPGTEY